MNCEYTCAHKLTDSGLRTYFGEIGPWRSRRRCHTQLFRHSSTGPQQHAFFRDHRWSIRFRMAAFRIGLLVHIVIARSTVTNLRQWYFDPVNVCGVRGKNGRIENKKKDRLYSPGTTIVLVEEVVVRNQKSCRTHWSRRVSSSRPSSWKWRGAFDRPRPISAIVEILRGRRRTQYGSGRRPCDRYFPDGESMIFSKAENLTDRENRTRSVSCENKIEKKVNDKQNRKKTF